MLQALPKDKRAFFLAPIGEGARKPISELVLYMETAKRVLAPEDGDFYRKMGRFAGRQDREQRAFKVMLDDPEKAAKMATTLWRAYFDVGRLEVVERSADGAVLRIHGFPAQSALCERVVGSIEGQHSSYAARAEETECVLRGSPYCEIRVRMGA